MCEMPIRALRLANGAEFHQIDKVKDIIAPGETLVASCLQVRALFPLLSQSLAAAVCHTTSEDHSVCSFGAWSRGGGKADLGQTPPFRVHFLLPPSITAATPQRERRA